MTLLKTIPIDQPFMYQQQGYGNNNQTAALIADGTRLIPFESMSFDFVLSSKVVGWLRSVCGNYSIKIGFLDSRIVGNKITFYRNADESGLTIPAGYYYIQTDESAIYQFKTEVFYIGHTTDELKGSFSPRSFNPSFDT